MQYCYRVASMNRKIAPHLKNQIHTLRSDNTGKLSHWNLKMDLQNPDLKSKLKIRDVIYIKNKRNR
jgi:hypothetical protein